MSEGALRSCALESHPATSAIKHRIFRNICVGSSHGEWQSGVNSRAAALQGKYVAFVGFGIFGFLFFYGGAFKIPFHCLLEPCSCSCH